MEKLFSTTDVHPRDRFDYWHDVACKTIVRHQAKPACRQTFQAEMQAGTLADIGLILFENSAMDISVTRRHCVDLEADELFVCRQVAGVLAVEQAGREIVLGPGDMTLLDPNMFYVGRFSAGSQMLVLKVPRRALEARVGTTAEMVSRAMKPTEAETSLTSSFLALLPPQTGRLAAAAEETISDQILDLVGVALATTLQGQRPKVSSACSVALVNVQAAIDARLSDPALDPEAVAATAGVSVRYANALLAREGTSLGRLIQARRLARCRRALEDPLQRHRTVGEIALGWGFSDLTHFGRGSRKPTACLPANTASSRNRPRIDPPDHDQGPA